MEQLARPSKTLDQPWRRLKSALSHVALSFYRAASGRFAVLRVVCEFARANYALKLTSAAGLPWRFDGSGRWRSQLNAVR
jgi:hypothetical protein